MADDLEEDYVLPDMPYNLLDPPMWNVDITTGQCGTWQKQYTKLHRGKCVDLPLLWLNWYINYFAEKVMYIIL